MRTDTEGPLFENPGPGFRQDVELVEDLFLLDVVAFLNFGGLVRPPVA